MSDLKEKALSGMDEAIANKKFVALESKHPDIYKFRPTDQKLRIDEIIMDLKEPLMPAVRLKLGADIRLVPWDGKSLLSSVRSSEIYTRRVYGFCSALNFCNGILATAYLMPACTCKKSTYSEFSLEGVDLSYMSAPRERGMVVRKHCNNPSCQRWARDSIFLESKSIRSREELWSYVVSYCQSNNIRIPPLEYLTVE